MNSAEYGSAIGLLKSNPAFSCVTGSRDCKQISLRHENIWFEVKIYGDEKTFVELAFHFKIEQFSYDFGWEYSKFRRDIKSLDDFVVDGCVRFCSLVEIVKNLFDELYKKGICRVTAIQSYLADGACRLFCTCSVDDGKKYKDLFVMFTEKRETLVSIDNRSYSKIDSSSGASIASYFFDNGEWRERDRLNSKALELCAKMDGILESIK